MLQYLIILLDDTSVSFCHYSTSRTLKRLISVEMLRKGIIYGMKENLNIQFVYPGYELPKEYEAVIETIDHCKIKPSTMADGADVVVFDGWEDTDGFSFECGKAYVIRTAKADLFKNTERAARAIEQTDRLNIVLTDIETFKENDFKLYKGTLVSMAETIEKLYTDGKAPQLNLLTDRMMLDRMNNCGAGDTSITLAPDGKFYVCPAFYNTEDGYETGSLEKGLDIKNASLYKLGHALLCRNCDAWQCRRCVWLNRKTTLEVNTPGHEQCVLAHLERNTSRELLAAIRHHGIFMPDKEIKKIEYLDPFEVKEEW